MKTLDPTGQFRAALSMVPSPLLMLKKDGSIIFANPQFLNLFGYHADELIGQSIEILVPDNERERHVELRTAYTRNPVDRRMAERRDVLAKHKNGQAIPVEISLNPAPSEYEGVILVHVVDISARRREEEKFRLAVEAATNAMIMIDETGTMTLVNQETARMFGYESQELLGMSVDELVPPSARRIHPVLRKNFAHQSQKRQMGNGAALEGARKDGTVFPVEIGLNPLRTSDGRTYVIATILDISKQHFHQREMEKKNADLASMNQLMEEKNEALRVLNDDLTRFAYSVSHDLKSPLNAIQKLSEAILEDLQTGDSEEILESAKLIRSTAKKLSHLVVDILNLSTRRPAEDIHIDTDLESLVWDSWEAVTDPELRETIKLKLELGVAILRTETTIFRQVIDNLLSNAAKYRDRNKSQSRITVSSRLDPDDENIIISIQDNGLGIPPDRRHAIFQSFQRFHPDAAEGTGLGLALVHKYITRLGGIIEYEAREDGTAFHIYLPHAKHQSVAA